MRGNLSVRVSDGATDRHVTGHVKDLRFRKTAPGGHHSASCRLTLPLDTFTDLGPNDRLKIYDTRTGETMWEGYTDNPGVTDGVTGESFDVSAMGGMALASDRTEKLIYLDSSLDGWRKDDLHPQAPSGTAEPSQFPEDAGTRAGAAGLFCQFTPGQPITDNFQTGVLYDAFVGSPMTLGAVVGFNDGGVVDTNYNLEWVCEPLNAIVAVTLSNGGRFTTVYAGDAIAAGKTSVAFRLVRRAGGATTVATDSVWGCFGEVAIRGHLVDRFGALRPMSTTAHVVYASIADPITDHILASEVAEDLLGRILTMCDPATAVLDESTAPINQITYPDGATAAQVLDDLTLFEPDFLWEIGATGAGGLHRFAYRAWPTTARYEISVKDGYNAPGGEVDLCNRIAVYWTNPKGAKRTTVVTQTVDALGTRTRDAESVTLPDGLGSAANALRIGQQILATKATPPKAATATVRRPIMDTQTGSLVEPWEIVPGHLVRVRETGDLLRLTEMEYEDVSCSATLTLGAPVRTVEQLVAALGRK